jgi:glycosyltransferase involved in cell wall biosynthesis
MLFLHCGEGWGQSGLEAMASGIPLVVSDHSGTREYADDAVAFPVRMENRLIEFAKGESGKNAGSYDGPWPVDTHAVEQMTKVMSNYRRASMVARAGAERARSFTWDRSARELLAILRRLA